MSQRSSKTKSIRSILIITAIGIATTGVSFAALQAPNVSLTSNIINSGSADLRISKDGSIFILPSVAGYSFDGVVPGGSPAPSTGYSLYLKNYGSVGLAVRASISANPTNLNNVNLSKTYLIFTRTDINSQPESIDLKTLMDSYASGGTGLDGTISPGAVATYNVKASMDSDAYTGATATISGINVAFISVGI